MKLEKDYVINISILVFLSSVWGTAFGAIKIAVIDIGPIGVSASRASIGGITLFFLMVTGNPLWLLP